MSTTTEYVRHEDGTLCLKDRTSVLLRLSEKKHTRERLLWEQRFERLEKLLLEKLEK